MTDRVQRLEPGTLWKSVTERVRRAQRRGALRKIPTDWEFVEQSGVRFVVRILSNILRKEEARRVQEQMTAVSGEEAKPFLPYEEELFITDISDTHLCLLNKFNVIDHHLLIVTREFEDQERLLNLRDFEAIWTCMAELDGLAFYNGGTVAGASQRHKHLQLIPLPFAPQGPKVPIDPLVASAEFGGSLGKSAALPYVHAIARVDPRWKDSPQQAAEATLESYHAMLDAVGLFVDPDSGEDRQPGPYNLLITRAWLLLLPRSKESFESIPVNSLGFAGSFFVRSAQELELLKHHGPMTILREVGVATAANS